MSTRRNFMRLGGLGVVSMLGAETAAAIHDDDSNSFQEHGVLAGLEADRPSPDSQFVQQWDDFHFVYISTDTGRMDELSTGDQSWSRVGVFDGSGGPWTDDDGDNLLEIPNYNGVDLGEQRVTGKTRYITSNGDEFQVETQQEKLTVTSTASGEVVGSVNKRGVLLPTSSVVSSDTTFRSRAEIFQVDTAGLGAGITVTIGTELENADQVFALKDVGGSASTNSITVEAESGTQIDGQSSATINSDYGRLSVYYSSAKGQWFTLFTSL